MIKLLDIIYYFCLGILFVVELPLFVLLAIFGCIFEIFKWMHDKISIMKIKIKHKYWQ